MHGAAPMLPASPEAGLWRSVEQASKEAPAVPACCPSCQGSPDELGRPPATPQSSVTSRMPFQPQVEVPRAADASSRALLMRPAGGPVGNKVLSRDMGAGDTGAKQTSRAALARLHGY